MNKHENRRLTAFAVLAVVWLCIGASLGYEYGYERGKKEVYHKADSLLKQKKHMQTYVLPAGTITVHDSTRTLPESRRVEHDCYALIESGIGSTQDDIDRHFDQILGLVGSDDYDAQINAINNTRFLFANLLGKQYSAGSLAFCCLVETVNGATWDDYSPEGIERLSARLDIPEQVLTGYWQTVKKNSTPS